MSNRNKTKKKSFPPFLFALAFATVVSFLVMIDKSIFKESPSKEQQVIIKEIAQQVSPYQDKENLKKIVLVQNFKNSARNGKQTDTIEVPFTKAGIVSGGYLYIKASADDKKLGDYSTIYTKLIHSNNLEGDGGHLQKNRSLETPDENKGYTELLYRLSDIPFQTKLGSNSVISKNWLQIINENENPLSNLSFSSTEKDGEIIELSIYYECLENTDCSLEE